MIADNIQKTTREEGSIHEDSYFVVVFEDGSSVSEKEVNWSAISEKRRVEFLEGRSKTVYLCTLPVKSIKVFHDDLETSVDIPHGCQVFQACRSEATFTEGQTRHAILGRVVGIVKDGKVIEERYLDGLGSQVVGIGL